MCFHTYFVYDEGDTHCKNNPYILAYLSSLDLFKILLLRKHVLVLGLGEN